VFCGGERGEKRCERRCEKRCCCCCCLGRSRVLIGISVEYACGDRHAWRRSHWYWCSRGNLFASFGVRVLVQLQLQLQGQIQMHSRTQER
jgi:hypothetical protein